MELYKGKNNLRIKYNIYLLLLNLKERYYLKA